MGGVMVRPCSHKNKRLLILNNNSFVSVNDFLSALSFSFQTSLFLLVKQDRISHKDQESLDSGTRHPFRSWSFITFEGEGVGVANLRNLRRFSNQPPIHPSFLEIISPHKFYIFWKYERNYKYSSHTLWWSSPQTLSTVVFLRSVFIFMSVTFNFNSWHSLLLWTTFMKSTKMTPK